MHLDDALHIVGEFGRYQKTRLFLLCGFAVVSAWHALNMVFVGAEPRFECSTADINASVYSLNQSELQELLIPEGESCVRYKPSALLPGYLAAKGSVNYTEVVREPCPAGYVFSTDEYTATITSAVGTAPLIGYMIKCYRATGRGIGSGKEKTRLFYCQASRP